MKIHRIITSVLLLALVLVWLPVQKARAATITVTNTSDSGPGSLRWAINQANSNVGPDTIEFNIPGAGVQTIVLASFLPVLTDNGTTIDGYTQFGAAPADGDSSATILIAINGTGIFNNGFNIISTGNMIRGLAIYGFKGSEIYIANYDGSVANDNVIAGNYLGTDPSGLLCPDSEDRGLNGVFIGAGAQNNLIGDDAPADRNLISCNGWEGVGIHGSGTTGNVVSGNYIGVDPAGTTSRNNALDGVRIYGGAQNNTVGGDAPGERNIISGNARDGVRIVGEGTTGNNVIGNYIGLEPDGVSDRTNDFYGVYLGGGAQNNTIGGDWTAGEGNVISGNMVGVVISDTNTTSNTVSGNYIGTDFSGTLDAGNDADGVGIIGGAQNNLIGGDTEGARNVISGNDLSGVYISGSGTTGNVVSGNYIGLDESGMAGLRNARNGVEILAGAQGNTIGGDTEGERNIISANQSGIKIHGAGTDSNTVSGNYIGTDADGLGDLGNDNFGVYISNGAHHNLIGGDRIAGEGNLISGNHVGVYFNSENTDGNVVAGNYIGTDLTGLVGLGNESSGVILTGEVSNNLIGGDTEGERNIIAGNGADGIILSSAAADNTISGNYIGLAADGTTLLPNVQNGIDMDDEAQNNIIGGDTPGERNVISGNGRHGIAIEGDGNSISGNYIGTDASGTVARGNMVDGIALFGGAQNNVIGGDTPAERNLIAGNGDEGIALDDASNNTVSANYIGTDASGTVILMNNGFGIYIGGGSQNNTIGGDTRAEGNIIAGSLRDGMYISGGTTTGNVVANNSIGTNAGGSAALGNGEAGIELDTGTQNNIIGPDNVIAHNDSHGIFVDDATTIGNQITQNSIFANSDLGIDLVEGAHGGIQPPEITAVNPSPITVTGTACAGCTVELFGNSTDDGEGEFYLGNATADGSGNFSLTLLSMSYSYLTATATDASDGTSEFSTVFTTTVIMPIYLPLVMR